MLTPAHFMLIDILSDKLITIGKTMAKVQTMSDEEVDEQIEYWDAKRKAETDKIRERSG